MSTALWWIRRDLRLKDNPALNAARTEFEHVIPIFAVDPILVGSAYTGEKRLAFLWQGLRSLDADLRQRGSYLVVRENAPFEVLSQLISQTDAKKIFAEADYSPYAQKRDEKISQELPVDFVSGPTLRHPDEVLKRDGSPYTVFSPFMRTWKSMNLPTPASILPAPERISTPENIANNKIPEAPIESTNSEFRPGEADAQLLLNDFTMAKDPPIFDYGDSRNRIDLEGTSQLSPYLRFGMISARQTVVSALTALSSAGDPNARKGAETWLNELIWREFYVSILYHFPFVLDRSFRPEYQNISWVNNEQDFQAWCEGRTGYPIIDAAMRQLVKTGWMHNRARMVVASFLVKDLLIDWRWGEKWFMQQLIDGDPASNNGGWQWTAGTGTDSAPYFRVFNPVLQSKKFDPKGKYIRNWVPELASIPGNYIHEPWKMPADLQKKYACKIGIDYPEPIIDHAWARERVLEVYRSAKAKY